MSENGRLQGENGSLADRMAIRELVENWAVWRDSGNWDRFRTLWHPEGRMQATWTEGPFEQFIAATIAGVKRGVHIIHQFGAISIDISGDRAIAQGKGQISQRADVEGVLCDVLCWARSYDFIERRNGRWGIVFREPIYEKDRIDPVVPGEFPVLEKELLSSFPDGYRHLAYLQSRLGFPVRRDLPGLVGPDIERLYARGAAWLAGRDAPPA